jgi:hypothetical protein
MSDTYFIKRNEAVNGPFTLKKLQKALSDKKLKANDELSTSSDGPWERLSVLHKDIRAGKHPFVAAEAPADAESVMDEWTTDDQPTPVKPPPEIEESAPSDDAYSLPSQATKAVASTVPVAKPTAQQPQDVSDTRQWNVEQLDSMAYIVDDSPYKTVFKIIAEAAALDHTINGAFARSGIIRGEGQSGITIVITVKEQDDGTAFEIDGETPDGPVNFDAWFDPTSAGGWGLFAVSSLFNSAVNNNAAESVEHDILLLLYNILTALGADDLLPNNGNSNQPPNHQAAIPQSNVSTPQRSPLQGSTPSFDSYPTKYATEYARIYESGEKYKGSFNWMAFLFGPLWALCTGLWLHALLSAGAIIVTAGFLALPAWIYTGVRGTYILYCKDVKGEQKAL